MSLKDRFTEENPKKREIKKALPEPNFKLNNESQNRDSLDMIDTLLADNEINNIFINGTKSIYIEKKGKIKTIKSIFQNEKELEKNIKEYLEFNFLDFEKEKFFKLNYKKGINISITLPPLCNNAVINLKCYFDKFANFKTMEEYKCLSKEAVLFLEGILALDNINILITGSKKSLKTTLLSALLKSTPENDRCFLIDFSNEIETNKLNCTYFNFSILNNQKQENEIINSLLDSKADKFFINESDKFDVSKILKISKENKGIITTLSLENFKDFEKEIYNAFDIIIFCDKFKERAGKITKISQTQNQQLSDIFYLEENKLSSSGIIPDIYNQFKENNISFNQNIFDKDYKHTYSNNLDALINMPEKKNINPEILKKFKKDLFENETKESPKNNENERENL